MDEKVLGIVAIILAILSLGLAASGLTSITKDNNSMECVTNSVNCPITQITFDTTVSGNNSGTVVTGSWQTKINETIVVAAEIGSATDPFVGSRIIVTSVTDSLNDQFTKRIAQYFIPGSFDNNAIEIWTGKTQTIGTNQVTVTWNETSNSNNYMVQVSTYTGVSGFGSTNSTATITPTGLVPLTLTTSKGGSWIVGASNVVNPTICPNEITTSPSFVRRIDTCSPVGGIVQQEGEISDNATALRSNFKLTYSPSGLGTQVDEAVIELTATDLEPVTPDFLKFCVTVNSPCTYLTFVGKATGPNSLVNIVVGTAYCTGVTSVALNPTIVTGHGAIANGEYNGQSRNDTGAVILVQLYVSTNAPSTSFAAGLCASGGTIVSTNKITFDTSGTTLTAFGLNEYSATNIGTAVITGLPVYEWYEITPQSVGNVNTGLPNLGSTIQYAQWGSHCVLQLGEIR